jgi:Na+-transporting methylmalonyl-CoA/oxaloacetate decarboxylase gamma subunit
MNIDINAFLKTLPVDLYGMAGVFIVMGFIYACIKLMNKVFANR